MTTLRKATLLAATLITCTASLAAQNLVLENARIVNIDERSINSATIVIENGVIASVSKNTPENATGDVINLNGQYVIPTFMDMHTHSFGNALPVGDIELQMTSGVAKVMLYCGVSGFLDLFSDERYIFLQRDEQRANKETEEAEIFAAGPIFNAEGGHGSQFQIPMRAINNPNEAKQQVDKLAPKAPDVIKIVYDNSPYRRPTINKETLVAAIQAAKDNNIRTVVHVGTWQDAIDVLEAGGNVLTHTPSGPMPDTIIPLMIEKQAYIIPTIAVHTDFSQLLDNPSLLDSPLLAESAAQRTRDAYRSTDSLPEGFDQWLASQRRERQERLRSIDALSKGGVPIMVGTDAGNVGVFQGYSVHRELALFVEAGLTPWEALKAGTTIPGRFFGRSVGFKVGDMASFVVLEDNPIDDIHNTEEISHVIHHGKLIDRTKLIELADSQPSPAE